MIPAHPSLKHPSTYFPHTTLIRSARRHPHPAVAVADGGVESAGEALFVDDLRMPATHRPERVEREVGRERQARQHRRRRQGAVVRPVRHAARGVAEQAAWFRSEEHTSELQSLMRISYAVFCLKKKKNQPQTTQNNN